MSKVNASFALEGDVDHVHAEKLAFRREAVRRDGRASKIIELYAGTGRLSSAVYAPVYGELVAVERDAGNFRRLVHRLGRFHGVRYYRKDNADFIAEDLGEHLDFSAVDFDDFGCPGDRVIAFFEAVAGRAAAPFLLLMTDGGLLAARRRARMNLFKYYLAGPDAVRAVPADLADRFEGFQAAFVRRLAAREGFAAEPAAFRRNHNQTVLYSAYEVTPGAK